MPCSFRFQHPGACFVPVFSYLPPFDPVLIQNGNLVIAITVMKLDMMARYLWIIWSANLLSYDTLLSSGTVPVLQCEYGQMHPAQSVWLGEVHVYVSGTFCWGRQWVLIFREWTVSVIPQMQQYDANSCRSPGKHFLIFTAWNEPIANYLLGSGTVSAVLLTLLPEAQSLSIRLMLWNFKLLAL